MYKKTVLHRKFRADNNNENIQIASESCVLDSNDNYNIINIFIKFTMSCSYNYRTN